MRSILTQFGKPKVILLLASLFVVNLILFSIPALAGSRPQILAEAPGYTVPDMKAVYSPAYVHDFLSAIGPAGRHAYQMMHLTTDLAFPFAYGLLLFTLLCRSANQGKGMPSWLPFLVILPVAADLAENFTMMAITASFPAYRAGLTWLAQAFTLLKFGGIAAVLVVLSGHLIRRWQSGR